MCSPFFFLLFFEDFFFLSLLLPFFCFFAFFFFLALRLQVCHGAATLDSNFCPNSKQQKERVKLGKLELQECADNQQKEAIMEWKGEAGKTGAVGMCRQAPKRRYYGMKGWSWENWSCRNVQATTKKKLLWNERVKFGKLELQKCADNQQKEVLWNERLKFGKHWSCSQFKLEPQPPEHCSPDSLNCMILAHHQSPHHPHLQASYQLCFQACCQNPVHPSSMVAVLSK